MIRVRFAPSPTGFLHIGGARTAIFNWLFARKNKGTFILRIEDTDEARSTDESIGGIIQSLKWLGVDWDEGPLVGQDNRISGKGNSLGDYGPYFQMERLDMYKKYAQKLLNDGMAYYCYCTQDELKQMREEQTKTSKSPKYAGRCRELTAQQVSDYKSHGRNPTVRFKMPLEGKTKLRDSIRGEVEFENGLLDDFVILKANGVPTYNFACVVDDFLMKITNVIRGDDHLSNTPRQIQVYKALGFDSIPEFAHLSMILGPDGSRLSKRHGATSVMEYKNEGYLEEAIFNYLVLLGWSTEDSQQIFEKDEVISKFTLDRCAKNAAIFDPQKLLWMNGEYIRKTSVNVFVKRTIEYCTDRFVAIEPDNVVAKYINNKREPEYLESIIKLTHEKIKLLKDVPVQIEFFLREEIVYDEKATKKVFKDNSVKDVLLGIYTKIEQLENFTHAELEKIFRDFAVEKGIKTSALFHPVRVAISGRTEGPGLFEMIEILGREKVLGRIKYTVEKVIPNIVL